MIPPFFGSKIIEIPTEELFKVLSKKVLFEGRWGFSKGKLSDAEYKRIIETKAKPALEKLILQESENPRIDCKAVYGFFHCHSDADSIIVDTPSGAKKFTFPRKSVASLQKEGSCKAVASFCRGCLKTIKLPKYKLTVIGKKLEIARITQPPTPNPEPRCLSIQTASCKGGQGGFPDGKQETKHTFTCLSDFISLSDDYIAFFAVTIGSKIIEAEKKLFEANGYYDYHLLHGLGAEMADCGAVVTHRLICEQLLGKKLALSDKPLGCRYSFGYPACPELSYQKLLFDILEPSKIGLSLTESYQMVPELSVSGFILFNPEARYIVP